MSKTETEMPEQIKDRMAEVDVLRAEVRPLIGSLVDKVTQEANWADGDALFFAGDTKALQDFSDQQKWFRAALLANDQNEYRSSVLDNIRIALEFVDKAINANKAVFASDTNDVIFINTRAVFINISDGSSAPKAVRQWYRNLAAMAAPRSISDPETWLKRNRQVLHASRFNRKGKKRDLGRALVVTHPQPQHKTLKANRVMGIFTSRQHLKIEEGPATAIDLRPVSICWNERVIEFDICDEIDEIRPGNASERPARRMSAPGAGRR